MLSCEIQNAYLTALCHKKVWTISGPDFGSDAGKFMIVVISFYSIKSSIASLRAFLADTLYDIGYVPSTSDTDAWMSPAMKDDSFQY